MKLKNKKAAAVILTAVMMLSLTTASALAVGSGQNKSFVDTDSNGVCDNYAAVQGKGSGYRNRSHSGHGNGCRYGRNR